MKQVLLISPYFLPSNVAGVHRVRLMSGGLALHGWTPTIVAVDPFCYEEPSDPALLPLIPDGVRIERVSAWPAWFCRPFGLGDISLRSQFALRRKVGELVRELRPAVIFATVLPGYTSLVGSWAKKHFHIPFVLDYQDPWVSTAPNPARSGKARAANFLACVIEPKVLPNVDALTAVSNATLDSLRSRNLIATNVPIEIIPIGADAGDHSLAARFGRSVIKRDDQSFHITYVGTVTHHMRAPLAVFLEAVQQLRHKSGTRVRVYLIGTFEPDVAAMSREAGMEDCVTIHPSRVGYLDALRTMQDSDMLVLLGSIDSHYTASKLFPYWLSGKPIVGLFHKASTVVPLSEELGGVSLVLFDEGHPPSTVLAELLSILEAVVEGKAIARERNVAAFEPYSSSGVARRYARLFDRVSAPVGSAN
jgi:glycosyltransferase involved in cell wall biosynthesis